MKVCDLLHNMIEVSYTETGRQPTRIILGAPIYMSLLKEMQETYHTIVLDPDKDNNITFDGLEVIIGVGIHNERLPDTLISIS